MLSLAPADLPEAEFIATRHLHVSGYTLLKSGSRMAGLAALDLAQRRGMTSSVDVSSTAPLLEVGINPFLEWTSGTQVCFANAAEANILTGMADPEEAMNALLPHYDTVVIKLGARGSLAGRRDGQRAATPAVSLDVIDTTGAGDAFAAGFLIGWTSGKSLMDCLLPASVLAARAVGGVGRTPVTTATLQTGVRTNGNRVDQRALPRRRPPRRQWIPSSTLMSTVRCASLSWSTPTR